MKRISLAVVLAVLLSGCAQLSPQSDAGLNRGSLSYDEQGRPIIDFVAGKESESTQISVRRGLPEDAQCAGFIEFEYKGEGIKAFPAFEARAAVERAQAEVLGEVAPGLTDAILGALVPLF